MQRGGDSLALWPQVRFARKEKRIHGFFLQETDFGGKTCRLNGMSLQLNTVKNGVGGLLLIETGNREFLLMGINVKLEFFEHSGDRIPISVLDKRELVFDNGQFQEGRCINGDQRRCTTMGDMPAVFTVKIDGKS